MQQTSKSVEQIDEHGSYLVRGLFSDTQADSLFQALKEEVSWQHMYHAKGAVPRLVACQGAIDPDSGSMPIYRHPSDRTLSLEDWTPSVRTIKQRVEQETGLECNHVLIQLYRSGQDFISEHSDKTLDISLHSKIANVSLGAQRTMRLRNKKIPSSSPEKLDAARQKIEFQLSHNSMFVMSLATNRVYLHAIRPDKRRQEEREPAALAYDGVRVSLTFRSLATFISRDSKRIWGQGAVSKTEAEANETISGDAQAGEALIKAFALENKLADSFDWDAVYGSGFDVLHLQNLDT